jgi:hypothetical protein
MVDCTRQYSKKGGGGCVGVLQKKTGKKTRITLTMALKRSGNFTATSMGSHWKVRESALTSGFLIFLQNGNH